MNKEKKNIIEFKSPLYYLEIYLTGIDDKFIDNLERRTRYQQENNFQHCSYFVARSEVKSSTAKRSNIATGQPGRRKIIVKGKKVPRHIHIGFIGYKDNSAWGLAKTIRDSLNKRAGRKVARIKQAENSGFIDYCFKQSYKFHTGGFFKWEDYFNK